MQASVGNSILDIVTTTFCGNMYNMKIKMRRRAMIASSIVISHCLCIISLSVAFLVPLPKHHRLLLPSLSSSSSVAASSCVSSLHSSSTHLNEHDSTIPLSTEDANARENNDVRPDQEAILGVREIMAVLQQTYPEYDDGTEKSKRSWIKTRKYLYQYCASNNPPSSSRTTNDNNTDNNDNPATENNSQTKILHQPTNMTRKKTRRNTRSAPLTHSDLNHLLSFLRTTFPNHPELQAQVLQKTPRILGQCHSIESRLVPTVDFLKGLYGGMGTPTSGKASNSGGRSSNNMEEGGMFYEAISRNTDLLLVRGVGYAGNRNRDRKNSKNNRNTVAGGSEEYHNDDNNNILAVEEYLQHELSVSSTGIAKLKRNHPTLFQLSLNGKVRPVVQYLYSLMGHTTDTTTPTTTTTNNNTPSPKHVKQTKQVAKMVTNHPNLLQLDVRSNLEPTARFLRDSCDLTDKELANVIAATPGVLGLSVEGNLKPTMQFLGDTLESGGIVVKKTGIVDGSGSGGGDNGGAGGSGGEGEDALSKVLLRKCILKHPQILALSLNNLMVKREYFDGIDRNDDDDDEDDVLPANENDEGDDDDDDADENVKEREKPTLSARILVSAPSTYSLSLKENIIPKIEYLGGLWGMPASGSDNVGRGNSNNSSCPSSLADNLREYPQILTLSKEGNIIPTLSFYNMTGYVDLDCHGLPSQKQQQQSSTMQSQPPPPKIIIRSRYIASSLYNRLLPRWHFLQEEREKQKQQLQLEQKLDTLVDVKSKDASNNPTRNASKTKQSPSDAADLPPLHLLAGASDDVFCRQMKLDKKEYLAFKEEAVPRLKFSSQFDRWLKTGRPIDLVSG